MGLLLLFWVACGVIAALIGEKKGEAGMGCLFGFLLGPLGLLLTAFSDGNRRACPHCREKIDPKATVCPKCQRDVTPPNP